MPDRGPILTAPGNPESRVPQLQLSQLCDILGQHGLTARLDGDDRIVSAVNTIEDAADGELTFLSNPKYEKALATTDASAVLVEDAVEVPSQLSAVRCDDPYACVTAAIVFLHGYRKHPQWGVSDRANVHETARIGDNPNLGPGVTISADAIIGNHCTLYPGSYVGDRVRIGDDCVLFPNVVVYDDCVLGNRVAIHAGSVIGQDGLGYAPVDNRWVKIPQVGRTVIADDVEIGANCAIDRATLGRTEVGPGTKFGNVVVIGHGTKVGPDCLFVGQVGLAGSVTVGRHVTLAGQVGSAGHLTIGDDARVGAQAGIKGDLAAGGEYLGSPAIPIDDAKRSLLAVNKLPDWIKRVRALEREVASLREQLESPASDRGEA